MRGLALIAAGLVLLAGLVAVWLWIDDSGAATLAAGPFEATAVDADRPATARPASLPGAASTEREGGDDPARSALEEVPTAAEDAPAASVAPTGVHGRVIDEGGAPVSGARVLAVAGSARGWLSPPLDLEPDARFGSRDEVHEAWTDGGGRYAFETDLDPGSLRLLVRAAGFVPARIEDWKLPEERPHALSDVVLAAGARLTGTVVDEDNRGVSGAALLLAVRPEVSAGTRLDMPGRGVPMATTADDGGFVVDELEPGPWTLLVDAPGYLPRREQGQAEIATDATARFVLQRGMPVAGTVVAPEERTLEGLRVTARRVDAEKDEPPPPGLEGTELRRPRHGAVGPEGEFRVDGLLPGARYRMTVWEAGEGAMPWRRLPEARPVSAFAGERGVELSLGTRSALLARVVDDADGTPIEEFLAYAGRREQVVRGADREPLGHHPDGRLRCEDLDLPSSGGEVQLRIRARGYAEYTGGPFRLAGDEEHDLGEVRLERAPLVAVRVTDAASGEPIPGARVLLTTDDPDQVRSWVDDVSPRSDPAQTTRARFTTTEADGWARIAAPVGEGCHVMAGAEGYRGSESRSVVVASREADAPTVELALSRGGRVVVRVVDPDGEPVADERVAHRRPGETQPRNLFRRRGGEATDRSGEVVFDRLEAGLHEFALSAAAMAAMFDPSRVGPSWVQVAVTEGGDASIELVTQSRGGLRGLVREAGRPLTGAQVRLVGSADASLRMRFMGGGGGKATQTDEEGRFELLDVPVGEYTLFVTHPTRAMQDSLPVTVASPPQELELDLTVTMIEGRVSAPDGSPLAGLRIAVREQGGGRSYVPPTSLTMEEDETGEMSFSQSVQEQTRVLSEEDGRYALRGVLAGKPLVVVVSGDDVRTTSSDPLELAPDEVRRGVDLEVPLAGSIVVRLAEGESTGRWYRVTATRGDAEEGKKKSRETYVFRGRTESTIRGLEAGSWALTVTAYGSDGERGDLPGATVEVVEGEPTEFLLRPD